MGEQPFDAIVVRISHCHLLVISNQMQMTLGVYFSFGEIVECNGVAVVKPVNGQTSESLCVIRSFGSEINRVEASTHCTGL